ncbi:MAG: Aspartokinase, partial [uncultured Solirubrobacterales bacterium]
GHRGHEVRRHVRGRRRAPQAGGRSHRAREGRRQRRGGGAVGPRGDHRRARGHGRGGLEHPRPARDGHAPLHGGAHLLRAGRHGDQRPRPPGHLPDGIAGGDRDRHVAYESTDPRRPRRPHPRRAGRRGHRPGRRVPGRLDRPRRHHPRPRRDGPHRRRRRRRARRRRLRDLHGRHRGLLRRPADRPRRAQAAGRRLRGDARDGVLGREGAADALRRVRAQPRRPHPLPYELHRRAGHHGARGAGDHGTPADHRRDPLHRGGPGHAARRSRRARGGGPHLHLAGRGQRQRGHDRAERAGGRGRQRGDLLHRPARGPAHRARHPRALRRPGAGRGRRRSGDGQGLHRRRRHEDASGRGRQGVRDPRGPGDQHRDDLHEPHQDLLRHPRRPGDRGGPRAAHRVRAGRGRRARRGPVRSAGV